MVIKNGRAIDRFTVIKRYFDKGIYSAEDVEGFVPKSITAVQFEEITGIKYEMNEAGLEDDKVE